MGPGNLKPAIKHVKESLIIALLSSPAGLIFCTACRSDLELALKAGVYSAAIWVVMWKGNEFIAHSLDSKLDWLRFPQKRLFWGIATMITYPITAMWMLNVIFGWLWNINTGGTTLAGVLNYGLTAVVITFLIGTFLNARQFFLSWRQVAIMGEKIKQEAIVAKYESLKNQVNPHFLFNSLNALTTLVYEDQDKAALFIKQLSNVYRYVLESRDKELVPLSEEIEFLKSYSSMQKTRHPNGLHIKSDIDSGLYQVAPLSVQMLVENAIKHNEVSDANPLTIRLFLESDEYLVIENSLQKRSRKKSTQQGVGLENIKSRYEFLTNVPLVISETRDRFIVKLPLLTIDEPN